MTTMPSRLPRLYTVAEVAKQLSISTKTVRRWLQGGQLHAHRLGRQLRLSEEDLVAFLARCRK